MSRRNTQEAKAARRSRRTLRKSGSEHTKIDLIQWIKLRANVSTRQAYNILDSGALKVDSHTLHERLVSSSLRGRITVHAPKLDEA